MIQKFYMIIFLFALCVTSASAQDNSMLSNDIKDEMTKDPEQNQKWKMGEYSYSAKPKNAWELGVHIGSFFIDGDVDEKIPNLGFGLHLRKAIHYVFSLRADFFYGQAKGLESQPWSHRSNGGGLVEAEYAPYANGDGVWFPAYKTKYMYGALQGVINIGNILFHKDRNKWNWYIALGAGLNTHTTKLDLLNGSSPYTGLIATTGYGSTNDFDTKEGRAAIKDALNNVYDGEYETEGPNQKGIFRLGDETNIHWMFTGSMGIARKLSKRINLGVEHQVMLADNDYLDGIKFRTALDQTNNNDIAHYTNIRLAINLGNFDKVTEPLYWLNPLDATMNDIAELKQRPVLDLTDDDGDGIINMLDQEIDSPAGCAVDTRGITLDSDGDGIPDCKDQEPFSPPGFDVNSSGVAQVPAPGYITEEEANSIFDSKAAVMMSSIRSEWFLPMVHFDLDKYSIKPEFYGHLHHVATVMKMYPDLCVTAVGHTDVRSGNDYNNVLSYNRAKASIDYLVANYNLPRSNFKLMWGGKGTPLVGNSRSEAQHYMNRRVEFRVCDEADMDMGRPEGPEAGKGERSNYSGNKNSGY
jgi:outer membrane protein OmpA-like peptidoglycan-associated protein